MLEENFDYNVLYDDLGKEDFIDKFYVDFIFVWKEKTFMKIKSIKNYLNLLYDEYANNNKNNNEKIWYLMILSLLKRISLELNYKFALYAIHLILDDYNNYDTETMQKFANQINQSFFILYGDSIMSSLSSREQFSHSDPFLVDVYNLKKYIFEQCGDLINLSNIDITKFYNIINPKVLKNKFFEFKDFYYDLFIMIFISNYEDQILKQEFITMEDKKCIYFNIVEKFNSTYIKHNCTKITNIFCSQFTQRIK